MVAAQEIAFFAQNGYTGENSPVSHQELRRSTDQKGESEPIEAFNLDEEQRSFEDDPVDEDEEEDRAVADFVSEIELNSSNVKLRRGSQNEEENVEHQEKMERRSNDED